MIRSGAIYLDHNATAPMLPDVSEIMLETMRDVVGNPSSLHRFGRTAKTVVERARSQVAALIGAQSREVVFVSGGTEANNMVVQGVVVARGEHKTQIVTSSIEHQAMLNPCRGQKEKGSKVIFLPVDAYGRISPDSVDKVVTTDTSLVTIMHANNEVGTVQPLREIAELIGKKKVLFHTDAVQSAGRLPLDVGLLGVDLLSLSAHKIGGPKGIGALFIKRGTRIEPLIAGGHQEMRMRAGTENVSAIAGFGLACEVAAKSLEARMSRIQKLRDCLEEGIRRRITGTSINGHMQYRLPNTLNVSFAGVDGEELMAILDEMGIAVSTASACTSDSNEPSHVLVAMGRNQVAARGAIRFSMGEGSTKEEIKMALNALVQAIQNIRDGHARRDRLRAG